MTSRLPKILLISVIFLYLFHFLFFWLFESTDSYFYWEFSNFIKTGKYLVEAYNYTKPSTMEPPLYSGFLYLFQLLPRADILVHFFQLSSILASGFFLYKVFQKRTKKPIPLLLSILFLLTPSHMIYTSNLVAEPFAVLFLSFFLFLLSKILGSNNSSLRANWISYLIIFSTLMIFQRYNLMLFLVVPLILGLQIVRKRIYPQILFAVGVSFFVLLFWVRINHNLNGSMGFSNAEGKHLYNRVFHFDHLLPPENNPDFVKFKKIVEPTILTTHIDYFHPWWFYEPDLIRGLGGESEANELFLKISLAALFHTPVRYVLNTPGYFLFAHGSNPTFHDDLYRYDGTMKNFCRVLGSIHFCAPLVNAHWAFGLWDRFVDGIDWYYLNLSPFINFFIFFPALIYAVLKKDRFIRIVALLYLGSILFFTLVEAPLPRYTYIFTPVKNLIIGYFLIFVWEQIRKYKKIS